MVGARGIRRFGGIRTRITLVTLVVSLVAMTGVVGLAAYASQAAMEEIISRSLVERLDRAEELVAQGEYQQAIDHSGIELLQVIDADGHVIASTPNVAGYSAIFGDDDDDIFEVDDLELDEDDDADDGGVAAGAPSARATAETAPIETQEPAVGRQASRDADDRDDDPEYDDDDDADDGDGDFDEGDDDDIDDDGDDDSHEGDDDSGDDDDDDDDDGDDEDDDDDDDDARKPHGKAKKLIALPSWLFTQPALAEQPGDVHSIEVSAILNTPGPFLVVKREVQSPDGRMTLAAMTSLHSALETATRTAEIVAGLLFVLLLLAGLFAYHMTGRTLRPVDRMRREVEALSAKDLSGRITPPANDPDLSTLADTFNGLLGRIEASVNEQKRFISDASHELKSPIASTNLMLETLRQHPEAVDANEVLADLAAENDRLALIVNDLLMLARQDENRLAVSIAPVDFLDLLYEETASLRQRFPVTVDDSGVQPVIGRTDAELVSHAVRNLLDNAARYATGTVWVSCTEAGGRVHIVISDDGPGIPEADRERVFGRFVRLEEGRERKKGSTGLGLSVARGNVERLGGTVRFTAPEHGGATAEILLPTQA